MGLGATSYNYLFLKNELSNNQRELMSLSNQKMALARDSSKISREYQEALNKKVLKWSTNAGSSYTDLTYDTLMKPCRANNFEPYVLSDLKGRTVVDSSYLKFAKMISPDGKSGADYESVRYQILSAATGIPVSNIMSLYNSDSAVYDKQKALDEVGPEPSKDSFTRAGFYNLLSNNDDKTAKDLIQLYNMGDFKGVTSFDTSEITNYLVKNVSPYFLDKQDDFINAAKALGEEYQTLFNKGEEYKGGALTGSKGNYTFNFQAYLNELCSMAKLDINENGECLWYDITDESYSQWETQHAEWEKAYNEALNEYNITVDESSRLLTAEQENLIMYYDVIFSSIAENGWTENDRVNDTDYLNQMLQNNLYTITTVTRTNTINHALKTSDWSNDYQTNIASNFKNIFSVSDTELREEAMAVYEHKKNIINEKESRIDTRMSTVETETAAIQQMIKSLETIKNENIERTMSIFT